MGSKHAKQTQEYYSPFFCPNSKPSAKANKKSFDEQTTNFNSESVTKIHKNLALREHFNLCNIITKDEIEKLILSENFQFLFILHNKRNIDIYSKEEQKILYTLFEDEAIRFMILFDQKNAVYYVTDQKVFRWDYQENSVVNIVDYRFHSIKTISASPDFSYIAIGECYGEIILINCDRINSYVILESHSNCVIEIAFTQDSQYFISAGGDHELHFDCSIRVWNTEKKSLIAILAGHPITVYSLKIHDSGKFFLSLSRDCTIRLWDLEKIISNSSKTECQGKYLSSNKKHFDNNSKIHREMLNFLDKYPERNLIINMNYKFVDDYVMHVLKDYKENTEINRLKFSFYLFRNQNLPIAAYAFFVENSIVLLNPLDMKFVFFDMFGEVVQKTIELLAGPHTIINVLHGKIAYLDKEFNVYVQNLIDQKNKVIAFPVNNLELLDIKLRNSKFLLSFYLDLMTSKYFLTIWDLKKIVYHGSLIIDYFPPNFLNISENAEFLFLYTFQTPIIIIMDIAKKTILHKVTIKNQLMNSGFSDDCKYIFTIMDINAEHLINVWKTSGRKKKKKFVKPQLDKQIIIKLRDDVYFVESFGNEVAVLSHKNLNKKQKHIWGHKKNWRYGVLADKNVCFIYKLKKAQMMIFINK